MRVRLLWAAGVLSFVPAYLCAQDAPAAAPEQAAPAPTVQRQGSFELTLGGGVSFIDANFNTYLGGISTRIANFNPGPTMLGGELRATYNFGRHVGFGVGAGVTNGNGALLMAPFGSLTLTFDLNNKFTPFLDFGGGVTRVAAYTGSLLGDATHRVTSSYSVFGGIGFRRMISTAVAIRVEARASYDKFPDYGKKALNNAAFLGLSFFVGGGPPRDSDGDGVPDKRDACPDTPAGAIVDAQGCALDSDRDGVYDGIDQCPDTPEGAIVDAQGCALDSDHDGVYDGIDQCPNTPADARPVDARGCPVDSDGDGVPDYLDRCPNTPADARPVDVNGCPVDTDNDGVPDYQDRCPDTPAIARPVYPAGHARAGCPVDSDGDGTPDYLDRCPNTAPGTPVDANGCSVQRDSDGDGVPDDLDRCPNTPPGTRVDATGCPIVEQPAPPATSSETFVLRDLRFRTFRQMMAVSPSTGLDSVAATLRAAPPDTRWQIAGYTDNRGIPAGNLRLSQRRAQAVMRYLVARGVASTRLTAAGFGARNPVAPNGTAAGRAQNRRIEITRLP